jgi:hypothetical protein
MPSMRYTIVRLFDVFSSGRVADEMMFLTVFLTVKIDVRQVTISI